MKLQKIEKSVAKTGAEYLKLTIDGKTYNYFKEIDVAEGDEVLCQFEKNGQYTNLTNIEKVITQKIVQNNVVQEARHDVIINRTEKPHSYEFGKAGARHKIYYGEVSELLLYIEALKTAGLVEPEGLE